jgi:hypothetical protein
MSCCRFRGHRDKVFRDRRAAMQRRKYSREFKLEAVKLIREEWRPEVVLPAEACRPVSAEFDQGFSCPCSLPAFKVEFQRTVQVRARDRRVPPDDRVIADGRSWYLDRIARRSPVRRRGILCQGRGSAANSCVCCVLGTTSIDPVRHELLFERFIFTLMRRREEGPAKIPRSRSDRGGALFCQV